MVIVVCCITVLGLINTPADIMADRDNEPVTVAVFILLSKMSEFELAVDNVYDTRKLSWSAKCWVTVS